MHSALSVSKTGLQAQETNISVIANNLANVNTHGFKKGRAVFEDLMYQTIQQPGAQSSQTTQYSSGAMLGTGVKLVATQRIFSEGNVIQTNNPLDIAINGRGFYQVQLPDGSIGYSRDGQFQLDNSGQLVNSQGYIVQPRITIPTEAKSITIGADGTVSVLTAGTTSPTQVGTIQLADFINPGGLQPMGENLYIETASSGSPTTGNPASTGLGSLNQGSIESSNVNTVDELVGMIQAQRAYEMNAKAIGNIADMLKFVNQVV